MNICTLQFISNELYILFKFNSKKNLGSFSCVISLENYFYMSLKSLRLSHRSHEVIVEEFPTWNHQKISTCVIISWG